MPTFTLIRHPSGEGWTYSDGTPRKPYEMMARKSWRSFLDVAIWLTLYRAAHWWQIVLPVRQETEWTQLHSKEAPKSSTFPTTQGAIRGT